MSNLDTFTHASNIILDKKLLSCRTIGELSAVPLPTNPIVLAPQTLIMSVAKKLFADVTSGNAWTNWTPRQIIRTGVNRSTPGNIGHACGII